MLGPEMPSRETVVRESSAHEHVAQFYDTPESLAQTVADFVRVGLSADDVVLVVARTETWTSVAARLERDAVDSRDAIHRGRLVVLDAAATLAKFTRKGRPDPDGFVTVVGELVRELAGRGRLRVYGEMVDILAADAQFRAAIALEELWNDLAKTLPFALFCGYSAVNFGSPRSSNALKSICNCHSSVRVHHDDELAYWLVNRPEAIDPSVPQ